MAILTHLEAVATLLLQAAGATPSPFHEQWLRRLAVGFESLFQPIQRIAFGLDETAKLGCGVHRLDQGSRRPSVDPEEGQR